MTDTTPKTRISADVWAAAGDVAQRMGLNSERAAIEAVFRVFHQSYVLGHVPQATPMTAIAPPSPAPRLQSVPDSKPQIDCSAALDAVLSA